MEGFLFLKILLFLVIQMDQAAMMMISMEKGTFSLFFISPTTSRIEEFVLLFGQMKSQQDAAEGQDQNKLWRVSPV